MTLSCARRRGELGIWLLGGAERCGDGQIVTRTRRQALEAPDHGEAAARKRPNHSQISGSAKPAGIISTEVGCALTKGSACLPACGRGDAVLKSKCVCGAVGFQISTGT